MEQLCIALDIYINGAKTISRDASFEKATSGSVILLTTPAYLTYIDDASGALAGDNQTNRWHGVSTTDSLYKWQSVTGDDNLYKDSDSVKENGHSWVPVYKNIEHIIESVIMPCLCVFGIVGNILNIVIVSRQHVRAPMDQSAYIILIMLAISDMLCCISLLPEAFKSDKHLYFQGLTFWMLYELYGIYVQNAFSHISTWLIVMVAVTRFIVICYPLTSKEHVTFSRTVITACIMMALWLVIDLPYLWSYSSTTYDCSTNTSTKIFHSLDIGFLHSNATFNKGFMVTCSILGFIVPVMILLFCTVRLLRALRKSQKMQRSHRRTYSFKYMPRTNMTQTLITIVIVFIILILPSECLQIWFFVSTRTESKLISLIASFCNLLHTTNFAINFILYSLVNSQFRKTFWDWNKCALHNGLYVGRERLISLTSLTNLSIRSPYSDHIRLPRGSDLYG